MLKSINTVFNNALLRKIFLKSRATMIFVLLAVIAIYSKPQWLLTGFIISLVGELWQVWCFSSLVKNVELTIRGPYVFVRNPMYLARYLLILGFIVLTGNIYAVLGYTAFYIFYMYNRVLREEKRLAKLLGAPYQEYRDRTMRFLPLPTQLFKKEVWFFDWQVMLNNNGHWNFLLYVIACTVFAVYFYFWTNIFTRPFPWWPL